MRISVVGTGYVGLTTGVCLAEKGHSVVCLDKDAAKVARLKKGECPIYEYGLEPMMQRNMARGRLQFGDNAARVEGSDIVFIAVGTPEGSDGSPDVTAVMSAAATCAPYLNDGGVLVVKSTVPPMTWREVARCVAQARASADATGDVHVAVNPEFLKQGTAVEDTMHPARVVIGVDDLVSRAVLLDLYADWSVPIVITDPVSAMLIKYGSNCFLATKISFVNEMANLCDAIGADIDDVALGMGLDPRIGPKFLQAGLGYGGSCFPKDTTGLLSVANAAGIRLGILQAAKTANEGQVAIAISKLERVIGPVEGQTVAVFGVAFKAGTDDLRESRGVALAGELLSRGASVTAYDPVVFGKAVHLPFPLVGDPVSSATGASAVIITTDSEAMATLDWSRIAGVMRQRVVLDGRNILDPEAVAEAGMTYISMGRRELVSPCDQPTGVQGRQTT